MARDMGYGFAWAAGFFDGEGSVGFYTPHKRRPRLFAQIAQVDRGVLDRFQSITQIGNVTGAYLPRSPKSNSYYRWAVEGYEPVKTVYELLAPHLSSVKTEQFSASISSYEGWLANPTCWRGHSSMKIGKSGKYYCSECKSDAGKKGVETRWLA